jgi:vacuolar-type H+-ATPase subunit H
MDTNALRVALCATFAALAVAACDPNSGGTVGQKLDRAVEKTEKSVSQASEKTREALHENTPKVEQKLDVAGHKLQAATEQAVEKTKETVRETKDSLSTSSASRSDTGSRR